MSADTMSRGISRYTGRLNLSATSMASMNHAGRRPLVVDDGAPFDDFLIDLELRFERFHFVVHEQAGLALELAGAARDDNQRRFLGVRAGDRVDHVQPARAIGDETDAEAVGDACGAVGGEPDGGLVAEGDESKPGVVLQRVVQIEHEVAGNAENLLHARGVQLVEEKLMQLHMMTPAHSPKPMRAKPARSQNARMMTSSPSARNVRTFAAGQRQRHLTALRNFEQTALRAAARSRHCAGCDEIARKKIAAVARVVRQHLANGPVHLSKRRSADRLAARRRAAASRLCATAPRRSRRNHPTLHQPATDR